MILLLIMNQIGKSVFVLILQVLILFYNSIIYFKGVQFLEISFTLYKTINFTQILIELNMKNYQKLKSPRHRVPKYYEESLCSQKKKAQYLCASKQCKHQAILCSDIDCKCWKIHTINNSPNRKHSAQQIGKDSDCHIVSIYETYNKVLKKIPKNTQRLSEYLNEICDGFIEWIKQFRQRLQFIGLNQIQRKFLDVFKFHKQSTLTGKEIYFIVQSIKIFQPKIIDSEKTLKALQDLWKQEQQIIKNEFKRIRYKLKSSYHDKKPMKQQQQSIQQMIKYKKQFVVESHILTNHQQIHHIKEFFPWHKVIKQFRLIYRASQNNFQVSYFYKKCSNIANTIVLIKTEQNKIIGGYTPLKWKQQQNKFVQIQDPLSQSFIFSLTNNDKFHVKNNKKALHYWNNQWGPIFGGDLKICNNANIQKWSGALINQDYYNDKYEKNNRQSFKAFTGQVGYQFVIKQWEVFEIIFAVK